MRKAATMQPYGDAEAGKDRYESAAQTGTGIFKNAFADRWTTDINAHEPVDKWVHTEIIQHIIDMCGFSANYLVVQCMDQQQWSELEHVVMMKLDEIKDFKPTEMIVLLSMMESQWQFTKRSSKHHVSPLLWRLQMELEILLVLLEPQVPVISLLL
jgi:hypothetical protein